MHSLPTEHGIIFIVGSHVLGRLRKNETEFEGEFTTNFDILSNEYYKPMVDNTTAWKQNKVRLVVGDQPETRCGKNYYENQLCFFN